jgi:hypothetical protein
LHFQRQDGPALAHSLGVEVVFQNANVTRDGKQSKRSDYTFLKDDVIDAK